MENYWYYVLVARTISTVLKGVMRPTSQEPSDGWKVEVRCKGGNVYGYKININVSGKIEGGTSETQHTPIQL